MTELQKVELEILKEFICVCDKLNLTYFLVCGTALGAAKYKGFIPWDDDIDVGLPREDYNIFCEKGQALLSDYLFLQNSKTDKNYPLIFSKIRDCRTTYVEKTYMKTDMNHGVYIDVFPIDGYPEDKRLQKQIEKEKHRYALMRLCCLEVNRTWKTSVLVALQRICGVHKKPANFVNRLDRYISKYSTNNSKLWCNHGNWQGQLEYAPKEQYGNGIWTEFEGLRVRIPEKTDEYLTQKYGNWRADIPEDKKVGHHYFEIMDLEKPYTEYRTVISRNHILFRK